MEIKELQQKLLLMNRKGAILNLYTEKGHLFECLVDSMIVTRAEKKDFWLLWKSVGYSEGPQYSHTVKIVKLEVDDKIESEQDGEQWLIVDLTDDLGRRMHVELIEPYTDVKQYAHWRKWNRYKNDHRAAIDETDKRLLQEHKLIAEEW
jgi:hypothetical protein